MNNYFPQYTTDYISGVMSLRKPQEQSLKILEEIVNSVSLRKGMNLKAALGAVNAMYPICSDFERDFMSLTFALATGVGKTRLMGAFIAYLYTKHGIKNFFVVAPNTTIYEKLKRDLNDTNSPKYVFKGLGCFSPPPQIITDDEYKEKTISLYESDIRVFIYNIDKFNKESANMKRLNEMIGDSFYDYLSNLPDLVLIMDESHHYRAEKGAQALNDLKPLLGLELTATPLVTKGSKQVPFKNVVFEYPLSKAIEDGYTRTPFAVTRSDIDFYNFGDEQLDKLMLLDGISCHEKAKRQLELYAVNNSTPEQPVRKVKPFMLVVCNVFDPLVEALQKTHSATMDVRSIIVCAANAFESFLADYAAQKGISLSGRNGILQKRDALSAHISKKHRGMIEFVGQIRNAADHGADPDENNQVWTITNETASIYPCIIAALIKAIFLRDATGSIEV